MSLAAISDYKAYHILAYGTLLGSTLFQTFIGGPVAFTVLPRALFGRLQQATFPVFFAIQSVLPLIMAYTYPGEKLAGIGGSYARQNTGFSGVMAESNKWSVLAPLATIFLTSVANLLVVGPATTKTMKERHHQETRDGKKSYDAGPHSKEMEHLNKSFAILHSVSTIFNLAGLGYMFYYAFVLGERL